MFIFDVEVVVDGCAVITAACHEIKVHYLDFSYSLDYHTVPKITLITPIDHVNFAG
jgi:hypothetical protein